MHNSCEKVEGTKIMFCIDFIIKNITHPAVLMTHIIQYVFTSLTYLWLFHFFVVRKTSKIKKMQHSSNSEIVVKDVW